MSTEHGVTVDGVHVAYAVAGRPDAPPMVLLHALGERGSDWAPVLPRLADRFRVYALDLRGHGDSDWPGIYSFVRMRDDVLSVMDQLGLTGVTLVGHSMGGVVAYLMASHEPGRFARLVVEDVCPPYPRDRPVPARPPDAPGFDWEVVPAIVGEVNAGNPDLWHGLRDVTAPTLLVGGGPDSHIPQERLAEVAALIPTCELVTVPAGHLVHQARPERFAEVVLDWLGRQPPG